MNEDNILDIYRDQLEILEMNRGSGNTSPLVDEPKVNPITPSSSYGVDIESALQRDEMVELDIDLSFFQCEMCGEWRTGNSMYLVETNEPEYTKDKESGDSYKTLKREVQSWCAQCVLKVLEECEGEDNKNTIKEVNRRITELKQERTKIKRVQNINDESALPPKMADE